MCRLHLDHIDHLEAMLATLDAQVEAMMIPFRAARDLLATTPGIGPLSAAAVISEIGADYFTRRLDPECETRRLIARFEALGHRVTLEDAAA